jgi:cytochrome c-type biogenesis protein
MAPMLGVAFTVAASNIMYAVALVAAYAAGHCMVIIIAGTSAELVNHLLKWNENSRVRYSLKKLRCAGGFLPGFTCWQMLF